MSPRLRKASAPHIISASGSGRLMRPFLALLLCLSACDDGGADAADAQASVDALALDAAPDADVALGRDLGPDAAADAAPDALLEAVETIEIEVGDFVFDALAAGPADGTPVILLHGFPQTSYSFREHVEALGAAGYRAVAPDQRGYSPRARPEAVEDYALPLLGQDVLGMADALGFERFHLVGHDWGAAVTWFLGATAADRILTLNPISVPHLDAFRQALNDPDSDQTMRSSYFTLFRMEGSEDTFLANDAAVLRSIYEGVPADAVEAYVELLTQPGALRAALNWYRANDFAEGAALGAVSVPTMFIWGDMDSALGPDGAYLTEDFVDGPYRFEVIEGGTHWLPDAYAEQVGALLLSHLE